MATAENTDLNKTVSAESAKEFQRLQNTKAKTADPDPDPKEDARIQYVSALKSMLPEYRYVNDTWMLLELRDNKSLQKEVANRVIEQEKKSDPQLRQRWDSDDPEDQEWRTEYEKTVLRNINSNLNALSFDGEEVRESIRQHHTRLAEQSDDYQINNIGSILQNNPEKYADYIDPEDIKNKDINESTVLSLFRNDNGFRKMVIDDKLEEFDNVIDNYANEGVYNVNRNPDEYAKAYSIYNKYGSEALTDYTNILQHYDPEAKVQENSVYSAFRRFKKAPRYKDDNPFDYAQRFVGGQKQLSLNQDDDLYKYQGTIQEAAQQNGVDPALLSAVIKHESIDAAKATGQAPETIVSKKNAVGMGQLTADTARDYGLIVNNEVDERQDPVKNINTSARILADHLQTFDGNKKLALAAYNAGPTGATKMIAKAKEKGTEDIMGVLGEGFYEETAGYIPKVLENYNQMNKEKTETADSLTFTPRRELERKPRDFNQLTEQLYYTPENKIANSPREKTVNFINKGLEAIGFEGEFKDGITPQKGYDANQNITEAISQGKPIDLIAQFEYHQQQHRKEGVEAPDYKEYTYGLVNEILKEDGGMEQLVGTLAANSIGHEETDSGTSVYTLSAKELQKPENQHLKILVDGLKLHSAGQEVIAQYGDEIRVEPQKRQRRDVERLNLKQSEVGGGILKFTGAGLIGAYDRPLFQKELRLKTDEAGQIQGFEEHVPNNLRNFSAGALLAFTDIIPEAWGGIVGGWGEEFGKMFTEDPENLRWFHEQRHTTRDFYSGSLQEFTDPVIGQFSLPEIGIAGGLLAGYFMGISKAGTAILSGAGKVAKGTSNIIGRGALTAEHLNQLASVRKVRNLKEVYTLARGSKGKGFQSLKNAYDAIAQGKRYAVWPRYTIGSAGIETFTDPEYSLARFTDVILQDAVLGLKDENKWNVDQMYKTSGSLGRWAMDFFAGEMLGIMFDGMIGVGKLAKDYSWNKLRDTPALGLEYDPKTGNYKPEVESKYYTQNPDQRTRGTRKYLFPDIQRFVFNVRNGVENIPIGDIKESARKYATMASPGPHMYEEGAEATQADIAAKFVGDSNEFMGTFREDLRSIVRNANDKYGGSAKLSDDQIKQVVQEVENDFMNKVARSVHEFVGEGQEFNSTRFAEMLEGHPATLEDVTPLSRNGKSVLNRTEATILSKQNPGSYVIRAGDDQFKVYKPDPALWRFDLANRLRQLDGSLSDFDSTVDSHLRKFDLDVADEADVDKVGRVIETLESTHDTVIRTPEGREGVISGFNQRGWTVKWEDGTEKLYGEIRGLEGVPEKPPQIAEPVTETEQTARTGEFDEQGLEVEAGDDVLRGSQNVDEDVNILDLREPERLMRELNEEARVRRQEELEQVFTDPEQQVSQRIARIRELMAEGRHDEAEEVIREISEIRRGPESREPIEAGGATDLRAIVEADREAYQQARGQGEAATDMDRLHTFHYDRLQSSLTAGGRADTTTQDIQMLRGMGMSKQALNEMIDENFAGNIETQQFLKNYNESIDFGEGVTDELIRARVNDNILQNIRDEAFRNLPEKVKQQMVEQADKLANANRVDEPQRLINQSDEEVTAFRSWETANAPFKPARPNESGLTGKEYAQALAEDLGTDGSRSIAKLQKTQSGGKNKVEIRQFDEDSVVGENGEVKKIKNSQGLVVRVEPTDGQLPFYAIGRKNNIKSFPTRFVADQNGKIVHNQEWAFINTNVTMMPDGRLRRFKTIELPNGDTAYVEAPTGKYVLNVQNPERVDWYDYMGRELKDSAGNTQTQPPRETHEILTPTKVFRKNVDAIETTHPRTGQKIYRPVSPEDQALLYGKEVSTGGDARTPHVVFEATDIPKKPIEYLPKFSKTNEGNLNSHAFLAIPGLAFTGTVGMDENGDLTTFGKAALAVGALAMGGVMIRSMTGQFKIRGAYDKLDPKFKEEFDLFDWARKVDEDGTPRQDMLTDDESAMFNRLQYSGVPKNDFAMMRKVTEARTEGRTSGNVEIPEVTGETSIIRSDDYVHWSTEFNRSGEIRPVRRGSSNVEAEEAYIDRVLNPEQTREVDGFFEVGAYSDITEQMEWETFASREAWDRTAQRLREQSPLSDQPVITLELDETSQGLISRTRPGHEFTDIEAIKNPKFGVDESGRGVLASEPFSRRPVAWSRLQKAPDGRVLVDELQVDNALQKGEVGPAGNVVRDLYTPVLDDIVDKALRESDGEFYLTRGHMQAARYGDTPDDFQTRERARNQVFERAKEIQEESPEMIIREAETIQEARRITEDTAPAKKLHQAANVTGELKQTLDAFEEVLQPMYPTNQQLRLSLMENVAAIERNMGDIGYLRAEHVEGGYKVSLPEKNILRNAARQVYDESELFQNMFPHWRDFLGFTNEGNKSKGLINFYDNTLPNVLKKRYGAEVEYAKGDPKNTYANPKEAFHTVRVTREGLEAARGKTPKRINWETIGGSLGLVGLAATAYGMQGIGDGPEDVPEGEELHKAGLDTILLVLMGAAGLGAVSKRVRTKVGGHLKGKVKGKLHNNVDNVAAKTLELDGKRFSLRELHDLDVSFNPMDQADVDATKKWWKGMNIAMKAGKEATDAFKFSSMTQAGTQLLKHISESIKTRTGSRANTIVDKINDFILDANQQPSRIMRIATNEFNENIERIDADGNVARGYGRGAFQAFPAERGPQIVKEVFDSSVGDDNARKFFNDAVWRTINRGIRKVGREGAVSQEVPDHIKPLYQGEQGELFQQLDRRLLQNEEFVDYANTLRRTYDQVGNRYLKLMKSELERNVARLSQQPMKADKYVIKNGDTEKTFSHDDLVNMARQWVEEHQFKSYSEFRKTLNPQQRHLLRIAKKESDLFKRLTRVQNVRSRFTDLRGKYFPQMVDQQKVEAKRQNYIRQAEEQELDNPENWAYYQMLGEWREVNNVGDARGLIGFDPEKLDISLSQFDTVDDAVLKLKSVVNASERGVQDQFDEFVGSRRVTPELMEELGFIVRDTNADGEEIFRLRQPESFNPELGGLEHNIFDIANMENFKKYYNSAMLEPAMRRSKFLENPRKFNLPQSWALTDPQKALHKYSVDTGYRLHALEYGLYEAEDFVQNYLQPMEIAMRNTGFDDSMINRAISRTDKIFKNQWGIVSELAGKSPQEAQQYIKSKKNTAAYLQTFRNLNYAKYSYGFKYLDWFQPLISTMSFTSGRAMKEAFGFGQQGVPYQGIRQLEDILTDANVIKDKDMSFRFDQNQLDPTGEQGSVSGYLQQGSQKMADRLSSFSIEKWLARLVGVDVGSQSRSVRLLTDSFHGTNSMHTAHNAYAFMAESAHFARVAREMKDAGIGLEETFRASDGKTYNWQQIYDKLEDLGISKTKDVIVQDGSGGTRMKEVDYFIQQENQLQQFIAGLKNNERVSINDFDPVYADMIERQWHFATETYHGTNKAMRPESWNSQLGRTLSQFGSFTYNIGMQVTRKRLLDPMNRWISRYATTDEGLAQISKIQMPLLMKHIRSGNEEALRNLGVTNPKRAIAEFPVESISTMYRVMGGIGFSIATYTTLDIMRDIYAAPVNAALGEDQFQRTKETFSGVINPYAPKDQQVTFGDLFGGQSDAKDAMALMAWMAGTYGRSSYAGMYGSPFESVTRYGFRGAGSLVPVIGMTDRMISDSMSLMKPLATLNPEELPGETAKFLMGNLPILSSNVFTEARESARDKINQYQRQLRDEAAEEEDRDPFVRYR